MNNKDLAHRVTKRLFPLFMKNLFASNSSNSIRLVSSGKSRAIASLNAFVEGLPSIHNVHSIDYELANPSLLYFQ